MYYHENPGKDSAALKFSSKLSRTLLLLLAIQILPTHFALGWECGDLDWCHSRKDPQRTSFVRQDVGVTSATTPVNLSGTAIVCASATSNCDDYCGQYNGTVFANFGKFYTFTLNENGTFTKKYFNSSFSGPSLITTYYNQNYYVPSGMTVDQLDTSPKCVNSYYYGTVGSGIYQLHIYDDKIFIQSEYLVPVPVSDPSSITTSLMAGRTPPVFWNKFMYVLTFQSNWYTHSNKTVVYKYDLSTMTSVANMTTGETLEYPYSRTMLAKNEKLYITLYDKLLVLNLNDLSTVATVNIPGAGFLLAMAATDEALFAVGINGFYKFNLNNVSSFVRNDSSPLGGHRLLATPSYIYGSKLVSGNKHNLYAVKTSDITQTIKITKQHIELANLPRAEIIGIPGKGIVWGGNYWFRSAGYIDIGLRLYNGSTTDRIACEPETAVTSPLRISRDGKTYGIVLVNPSDSSATKIKVKTKSGVKAIAKLS